MRTANAMTELRTRIRFAIAALQGRPIARGVTAPGGITTNIHQRALVSNVDYDRDATPQIKVISTHPDGRREEIWQPDPYYPRGD